jgi:hypothetical protein
MSGRSVSGHSPEVAGRVCRAGALLLVASSTFACIFEQSNYDFGGRRTDPTEPVDLNAIDSKCEQGGCKQICGQQFGTQSIGENCKCVGGKCEQDCRGGSTCTCSAGGCIQKCAPEARCACSGGRCTQECPAGAICSCGGENCTCTGEGCNAR